MADTLDTIQFTGFNSQNKNVQYFIELKNDTYIFKLKWSDYCNCAFLSIYDYNENPIVLGIALTNNMIIRNYNLPYLFVFTHLKEETYEPTIDNISKEFALVYEKEDE